MHPNGKIKRYVDVIHGGHPQAFAGLAILAPLDVLMTMPPRRQHPTDGRGRGVYLQQLVLDQNSTELR